PGSHEHEAGAGDRVLADPAEERADEEGGDHASGALNAGEHADPRGRTMQPLAHQREHGHVDHPGAAEGDDAGQHHAADDRLPSYVLDSGEQLASEFTARTSLLRIAFWPR